MLQNIVHAHSHLNSQWNMPFSIDAEKRCMQPLLRILLFFFCCCSVCLCVRSVYASMRVAKEYHGCNIVKCYVSQMTNHVVCVWRHRKILHFATRHVECALQRNRKINHKNQTLKSALFPFSFVYSIVIILA